MFEGIMHLNEVLKLIMIVNGVTTKFNLFPSSIGEIENFADAELLMIAISMYSATLLLSTKHFLLLSWYHRSGILSQRIVSKDIDEYESTLTL